MEDTEAERSTFDEVRTEEDLGGGMMKSEKEKEVNQEEDMELLDKEADPEGEKMRKQQWRKLSRVERVGIRRLHHMTSHGTRNQMARMLRYSNAAPHVIKGVKFFRCPSCDRVEPEGRPQVVRGPDPYVFNEEIGLDIFTVKDVFDKPYQILHILCLGTCFHVGRISGSKSGSSQFPQMLGDTAEELDWMGWSPSVYPSGSGNPQPGCIHARVGTSRMSFQVGCFRGTLPTWQGREARRSVERNAQKGHQRGEYQWRARDTDGIGRMSRDEKTVKGR